MYNKRVLKSFLTLVLLCSFGFCAELQLKEKFASAQAGSFIVTEQNKTFTFLFVRAVQSDSITIEEVSIPAARFAEQHLPWKVWFESGAPGHTAWLISQINLRTANFEETFSYTHQGWLNLSDSNNFLTTLLNLPFKEVGQEERKRVGLPPGHGKADHRPLWNPRLIVEGHLLPKYPFTVWKTRWPQDGSDLARKQIEIYLPVEISNPDLPKFPVHFPYWIEVEGKIGSAKVRVVDSGLDAHSPKARPPARTFKLTQENSTATGLEFHLIAPSHYQEFIVLAEEIDSFGKCVPLRCQTLKKADITTLLISKKELLALSEGTSYRFLISAKESPQFYLETKRPYIYKQV